MVESCNSMRIVTRKTGLSPHVIRVWERRYGAVRPARTRTNRRVYSDEDVQRLIYLHEATRNGHRIGNIAVLPMEKLAALVLEKQELPPPPERSSLADQVIADAIGAIRSLDTRALEEILARAIVALGQHALLVKVIGPMAQKIGELWREGTLMAAHEHFASAMIRTFLSRNSKPFAVNGSAPSIVVGTPSGQLHELGAVMAAAAANDVGWKVIYLGPSLPAAEIAAAVAQNDARAVALSLVYPEDDPNLPGELELLRRYLASDTAVIVGGRAAACYAESLRKIGVLQTVDFKDFYAILDNLRTRPAAA
jgi:MerR family transcriptional regulator, light-induced transcriptional regulator